MQAPDLKALSFKHIVLSKILKLGFKFSYGIIHYEFFALTYSILILNQVQKII